MSDTNNNSNVNNQPSTATEVSIIPPGSQEKGESTSNKHYAWTRELDIALLEEVGNLGARSISRIWLFIMMPWILRKGKLMHSIKPFRCRCHSTRTI